METPLIQLINVLPFKEVDLINQFYDQDNGYTEKTRATTFDPNKPGESTFHEGRTSTTMEAKEILPTTQIMHARINRALIDYKNNLVNFFPGFDGWPVPVGAGTKCHREGIQILDYTDNQEYAFHCDESPHPGTKEYHRKISVVLYLKAASKGGGTSFLHKTYHPKPGQALIFPSSWTFPHAGEKVIEGHKRVAVTWYYVEKF